MIDYNKKLAAAKMEADLADKIEAISTFIFQNPELGGEEYKSAEYLVNIMKREGFEVTYPYAGEKTGFRAEKGNGNGPTIALLAEYDALPGYGENGEPGHACGHNWIAATSAGASIVLGRMCNEFNGKIVLIGTPAEESYNAKVGMINQGGFDDIDIILQAHLEESTEIDPGALALDSLEFYFTGKAAHAAQFPHDGINALDAVQLTYAGINALRQHVPSDVRIHGIVTDGGSAANVVPEHAACKFFVRAKRRSVLNSITEKVKNCVKGAAIMTGCQYKIVIPEPSLDDLISVPILNKIAEENLLNNGIDKVHREEYILPGSTDIGNVSYVCPTLYMEIGMDDDVRFCVHDRQALEYADSYLAHKKMHQVVNVLVGVSFDLYEKPELVQQAKLELEKIKNR
ncbi:M20 family metallopeptidase [Anaerovorax sp. IOR16]|uniref:M20 family metallopeptidase n=1 Tax=Anaerovorax sp. IOR16 TaxID=2773458 RepID=UPI0019D0E71D|nr:M20 family metallopeptidase [Anaerovorax sp. IOR16]